MVFRAGNVPWNMGKHGVQSTGVFKKGHVPWSKGKPAINRGVPHSEEVKRKISEAIRGEKNPNYGKTLTEAQRQAHSLRLKEGYANGTLIHPMLGRQHSEETKQKIREAHRGKKLTDEHKAKLSVTQKGHPGYMKGKTVKQESKDQYSRTFKHKWETDPVFRAQRKTQGQRESTRLKMSKSKKDMYAAGHFSWKTGTYSSVKMGCEIPYQSSYEKRACEMLEADPEVVTYQRCPFGIPYFMDGISKWYIPDFFAVMRNGQTQVIEIKPLIFVEHEINQKKFLSASLYCVERGVQFTVWTEQELGINS